VRLEGLGKLKKSTSSGTLTSDLPACSIVPQPTLQPRAPPGFKVYNKEFLPELIKPTFLSAQISLHTNFVANVTQYIGSTSS
jgi:hypothetical protein